MYLKFPILGKIPLRPSEIIRDLKIRDNPPIWAQFFKYGIFGVISAVLFFAIVIFAKNIWPDFIREDQDKAILQTHMTIVLACAFIPSNFFAYFTNRFFVFTPGKHSVCKEVSLFTLISALSFIGGEMGKRVIVEYGWHYLIATSAFAVSAAAINFITRKFIVFSN